MSEQPVDLDTLIQHIESQFADAHPVAKLAGSVILSERLGALADRVVGHYVEQSRAAGASWAEIGTALGVTKQAAQKRFVPRGEAPELGGNFARFTPRTRVAVTRAQNSAREAGREHVSVPDLVLAIIADPDSVATKCIQRSGLSLDDLSAGMRESLPAGTGTAAAEAGHVPFSPEVKRVYTQSLAEALRLGHNYVGTEHVLLALLNDSAGPLPALAERMSTAQVEAFLAEVGILPPPPGTQA
jgi:hypothetical protein